VLVNGCIWCLISGLTSGFEKESINSFRNLSVQQSSFEDISKQILWLAMEDGFKYFNAEEFNENKPPTESPKFRIHVMLITNVK